MLIFHACLLSSGTGSCPVDFIGSDPDNNGVYRWLGVDKVFLRENTAQVPPGLQQRLAPFVESGFLDLGALPGAKHPLQNRWYNRCSKPDMAGMHSWVAFIDLDEFMVVLDKCAFTVNRRSVGTMQCSFVCANAVARPLTGPILSCRGVAA